MPQLPFGFNKPKPPEDTGPRILTVSELGRRLRADLERRWARVGITGEISNFRVYGRSGHAYFTLKDRHASLSCVLWAEPLSKLQFRPQDGQEVLAFGRVSFYGRQGSLQVVVETLEPRGVGALQLEFQQRLAQLKAEGLMDPAIKRPVPTLPKCIGVVTSRDGAALRDVVRTIWRRDPNARLLLSPTVVQGRSAAFHIVQAIKRLDQLQRCDVILVVRGGGSLEDLWAFNEEVVARALRACSVPVIAGVGHESDTTLAELVADVRASTPTAAAEFAVRERAALGAALAKIDDRLHRALSHKVQAQGRRLALLRGRLLSPLADLRHLRAQLEDLKQHTHTATRQRQAQRKQHCSELTQRLQAARPEAQLRQQSARLHRASTRLYNTPWTHRLDSHKAQLGAHCAALQTASQQVLTKRKNRLGQAILRLEALSPLAVLGRGYAVARLPDGTVLRRAVDAPSGTRLKIRVSEGVVHAVSTDEEP